MEDREVTEIAVVVSEMELYRTKDEDSEWHDEITTPQGRFLLDGDDNEITVGAVLCLQCTDLKPDWWTEEDEEGNDIFSPITGTPEGTYLWKIVKE